MLVAAKTSAAISWPLVSFDKVAVAQSDRGQRLKQRDYLAEGSIPVIDQGQALVGGYTDDEDAAFVGDLPVVLFGDHTKAVKLIHHRFAVGADGIKIFRPAEGVRAKYLYYWMKSARIPDRGYGRHYQYLRALAVPLPPEEQQDEIVAELEKQFSRLDEAVANLQRVKANLKRYKASVLKDAVEGRLVPTEAELARREGRTFETGQQLLQRILEERRSNWSGKGKHDDPVEAAESRGNNLPEGWCWARIDQLTVVVRGGSPRPAGDPRFFGGTVPWITVGSLTADGSEYLRQVRDTLTDEGKERSRFIGPHTLLLTNSGATLGVPKITLIGGCINDGVAALLNVEYPLKLYLLHFLRTLTDSMRRINQGAAQPNLNTTIIKATRVPLPPVTEQQRIVIEIDRRMSLLSSVEMEVDANLKRAQALRQSTFEKAFSERQA